MVAEVNRDCKEYGLINKEHNGDYLETSLIKEKFDLGLHTINIAQSLVSYRLRYTGEYEPKQRTNFYKICLDSGRWKKWVDEDFDPEVDVEALVNICGHYVFSHPKFNKPGV